MEETINLNSREAQMKTFQEDFQMKAAKADLLGRKAGMLMNSLAIGVGTEKSSPLFTKKQRTELENKLYTLLEKL